jgi:hypothetical protein
MSPNTTREHSEPQQTTAGQTRTAAEHIEDYGGGHIKARHGIINMWLLVVYAILFVWALYYGFTYWGGLGPGLDYSK